MLRTDSGALRGGVLANVAFAAAATMLLAPPAGAQNAPAGAIRGSVYDKDFELPLPGVRVSISGTAVTTVSGADGNFLIERLPPGSYSLSMTKDGYERQVVANVVVNAGLLTEVRVDLVSQVIDMEELIVTGQDLLGNSDLGVLEIRAASVNVQDAISSEIISKAGATDVAGALKLVTGASVADGKYATVRGLSDRYTGTTLNGVRIPSADPRRRAVQIDLFPTGTIDNVTVTKTFTPDLQGDFTGGGVDIKTKSVPEGKILSGSFSVEHNSEASANPNFLTYRGGGVDFWGFAGSKRDLPQEAREPLPPFPSPSYNATPAQVANAQAWDRMVRSFSPTIGVEREAPGPNFGFSLVAGNRFDLGEGARTVGFLGAVTYSHKYDFYENGQNNQFQISEPDQPITLGTIRLDSRGTDEVLIGALGSFVYRIGALHEMGVRLVANQAAEDEARFQGASGTGSVEQNQSLHYTERTIGSLQLYGDHTWPERAFKELKLNWFAAFNTTRQDEPDVRFFRNLYNSTTMSGGRPSNSTDAEHSRRIFRDIGEDGLQGALNLVLPFQQWTETEGRVKAGAFYDDTDRDYEQRSFYYVFANQLGNSPASRHNAAQGFFVAAYPGQMWTDVFNSPDRIGLAGNRCPQGQPSPSTCAAPNQLLWVLEPNDENDVDYTGAQRITALYAMAELPLGPRLRLIGGARRESTKMSIVPTNAFGLIEIIAIQEGGDRGVNRVPEAEGVAEIDESALLPSLGAVYDVTPTMHLRASWSRTLARPTFRELAPVATEEFLAGDEFVGNPDLQLSDITNYDLRWEWLRKSGEVFSASVFYKRLTDPIELISFAAGGRVFVQPVNYGKGEVKGAELEARLPLDVASPKLAGLVFGTNLTIIDSEVDVPEFEQLSLATFGLDEPTRRLQGQPEYLFNANLSWDVARRGTSAGLFYNVVGDTLLTGAARGLDGGVPDTFEEAFRTLDATYTQKLSRGRRDLSVFLKARNLLRQERRSVFRTPGGESVTKSLHDTAILYSVAASLKW